MTRRAPIDPLADPDVPSGMSVELLKDLHLLTREGQLNQDARRKLKQVRHLVSLLRPALDDVYEKKPDPLVVDCGAGKSYLGFLLYELVIGPAGRGRLAAIESRPELVTDGAARARRYAHARFDFLDGSIETAADHLPTADVVTALHACDTATDDAIAFAITRGAEHVAVVPCCQAEVARQLGAHAEREPHDEALIEHALHRRELGSHLTNVVRGLVLEAHGYKVTVTELVGWEHSLKNELILAKRVRRSSPEARATLDALLARWKIEPTLVRKLGGISP